MSSPATTPVGIPADSAGDPRPTPIAQLVADSQYHAFGPHLLPAMMKKIEELAAGKTVVVLERDYSQPGGQSDPAEGWRLDPDTLSVEQFEGELLLVGVDPRIVVGTHTGNVLQEFFTPGPGRFYELTGTTLLRLKQDAGRHTPAGQAPPRTYVVELLFLDLTPASEPDPA